MKPVSVFLFFIFSATFIFAQSTKELDSSVVFSPLKNIPKKEKLLKKLKILVIFIEASRVEKRLPIKIAQGWYIYSIFQNPEIVLPFKIDFTHTLLSN